MRRLLILLFALLCPVLAGGQDVELVPVIHGRAITSEVAESLPPSITAIQAAVCRVAANAGVFQAWGTGVLLTCGCVLTADHTFREGGTPQITWADGTTTPAQLVARDPVYDLALLQPTATPSGLSGAAPATRNLALGDRCWTAGQGGPADSLLWRQRQVEAYEAPGGGPADWVRVTGGSRQGDSGGPVLTPEGEVVGVVWGTDGSFSSGTNTGRTQILCQSCCPPGRLWCPPIPRRVQPVIPVQPIPLPVPPTPTPACVTKEDLDAAIAALTAQVEELKKQPGPTGPPGPEGPPGKDGKDGKDAVVDVPAIVNAVVAALKSDETFIAACKGEPGKDAILDMAALTAEIEKKLKPLRFQTLNLDGSVRDDVLARLGDTVKIRPVIVKTEAK